MRILGLLILPLLLATTVRAGAVNSPAAARCEAVLLSVTQVEASNLATFLSGPEGTSADSVVKATGHRDGKVIFLKARGAQWVSRHNAIEGTLTAEGDVRLPIFLLGPELAAKLGYAIRDVDEEHIEVEVPDAQTLAARLGEMNRSLKTRGLEPVSYLPVRAGLVTSKQNLKLMRSATGDYRVYFPYADQDLQLVSHEASFHLGALLLNRKILDRARGLVEETQVFLDVIDRHRSALGRVATRLKDQIRLERNFEMEAGLASMVTSPGFSRRDHGMKSYAEIRPLISARYLKYMIRNIEYLDRPRMQPFEAVLTRVGRMTGLPVDDLVKNDSAKFPTFSLAAHRIGTPVVLGERQRAVLREVAIEYARLPRVTVETGAAEEWLNEFLSGLDDRIRDMTASLPN